jgi:hypothetical protein
VKQKKPHGVICIVKARSKGIHLGKSLLSVFVVAVFMVSRRRAAAKRQDLAFWATFFHVGAPGSHMTQKVSMAKTLALILLE